MPFPFSDWMPWWLQLTLLILGALFAFVWLLMPFAVFGVKGRLDALALQIEDLQAELRVLAVPPEERRPAMAASRVAAAPVVEPASIPVAPRAAEPASGTSDAYAPRPERPAAPRPTRFDPPPPAPTPVRAAPPVEPPPAAAPRPSVRTPADESRPMPWHDRPAAPPREPPFASPEPPPYVTPVSAPPPPPVLDRDMAGRRPVPPSRPDDEWGADRPRSEPTLRWPPRT
jgi:hypothetical protein